IGRTDDIHGSVKRADAVAQAGQAAAVRPSLGAADPVITDFDRALVIVCCYSYPGAASAGVLDHVGERLGAEEIDACLNRPWKSVAGQVELDWHGEPAGQGGEGSRQATLGQDRGVNSRRDLAQLIEPLLGVDR